MTERRVLGPAVKALRVAYGIKQSDLAIACDITPGYLSNIEAGRKQPAPELTRALAKRIGVGIDTFTFVVEDCPQCSTGAAA